VDERDPIAILIVAGGKAARCPNKLERRVGDLPLIVRVYRNLCGRYPVYISQTREFSPAVAAQLPARVIFDVAPDRGPLGGLVTTMHAIAAPRTFVVAGDMPHVDLRVLDRLRTLWQPSDQALVALDCAGRPQPLVALYDRAAFLGAAERLAPNWRAVKDAVAGLRWRGVVLHDPDTMLNINTEDDYRTAARQAAAARLPA
jgi:molybdenum cofactor guanylyltransferase